MLVVALVAGAYPTGLGFGLPNTRAIWNLFLAEKPDHAGLCICRAPNLLLTPATLPDEFSGTSVSVYPRPLNFGGGCIVGLVAYHVNTFQRERAKKWQI